MPIDAQAGLPKAHSLRLLLPVFFERDSVPGALERLGCLVHEGAKKAWPCWTAAGSIPESYLYETLPSVRSYLFEGGIGGCTCLRVPDATANTWFRNGGTFSRDAHPAADQPGERPRDFAVTLADPGIELFLSPHGAGVLSLAFDARDNTDPMELQDLSYRLSQVRPYTAFAFRLPHGERDPVPAPPPDAPLAERLGRSGGAFRLIELAELLLAPLGDLGCRRMQDQFSVYSVTRFGAATDFANPVVAASLRPFLTALAHVEECSHPGSLAITERLLNPRHWAAAGSLGAVHLVADQDPPHPFDEQRVPTVLNKYFVPYLVSMLQRVALQRLLGEARLALVAEGVRTDGAEPAPQGAGRPGRLRRLNGQALAYTVNGCFTEISSRESINQYYELVQTGLRVQDSFGTVQRALRDAEGMHNDRFQGNALDGLRVLAGDLKRLLDEAGRNARLVAHVQSKVEWLEVFFVSYYFTALIYYVSHGDVFTHEFRMWSLILAPPISGAIAFFGLKPHKLHTLGAHSAPTSEASPEPAKRHGWRNWGFVVLLFGVFFFWLSVGWLFCRGDHSCELPQGNQSADQAAWTPSFPSSA